MIFRRLRPFLFVSLVALGCGGEDTPIQFNEPPPPPPPPPPTDQGFCAAKKLAPWSRKHLGVGGAVAFNEVMYHPRQVAELEWIELYNPMGIDIDVSGFRLDGAVQYTFPNGTMIPSRGYLVVAANADLLAKEVGFPVAIGSYAGQLPDDAGTIELWNNAGRLLDAMGYRDVEPWPVIPDGSGASLAKRAAGASSEIAEGWTSSATIGGTPGADNFPETQVVKPALALVPEGADWKYDTSGAAPPANWASLGFDDASWKSGPATFFATNAPAAPVTASATFTADNFFALYIGKVDGSGMQLIGRDAIGDWMSAETFSFQAAPDDYVYVAAWEAPGDSGGPQSLIGQFVLPGGALLPTAPSKFDWVLGPQGASPGGLLSDPAPAPAVIQSLVAAANQNQTWAAPNASANNASGPWGGVLAGVFDAETQFIWPDTFNDVSATNTNETYVLFRSKAPLVPPKGATQLATGPTTTYFRTTFQVPNDVLIVQPWLDALVDDGAVFYLNGTEILRMRMPGGAITASTLASSAVGEATLSSGNLVDPNALLPGNNVLAVEVHQASPNDPDMTFGASLSTSVKQKPMTAPTAGLVFNEVEGTSSPSFWLELANAGKTPIDVGGYVIASSNGGEYVLPAGALAPATLRKVDAAELGFAVAAGDKLFLYTPDRSAAIDGVALEGVPRGRSAADPSSFLYPDVTTPGAPNAFVGHDEIVINEIMYHPPPVTAADGSRAKGTLEWIELYNRGQKAVDIGGFQLVDAIEYEIPAGVVLPPGGYLVVANDLNEMKATYPALAAASADTLVGDFKGGLADSGENLVLRDACGNPVDVVHYYDGGRWPNAADGGGSSLELRDPRADNASPEAWSASDEAGASTWQTITYEGVAAPSSVGPDGLYQEFVLGLLDAGVVLVDDISVVEDPGGAAKQLIQNGTFESGASSWRILGNHRRSEVIVDPTNAGNHVLRVVATGATEHMHNHLETTLSAGQSIKNGTTYRISLRAKWESGGNQLHTRLYFNRLAKTSELPLPMAHGTPLAPNGKAEQNLGPTYEELRHSPVVPQPYEPVSVSVTAADPDGVAGLTLFYSVNGGSFASVPMTNQGDGRFSATIPGAAASSIVQFYAAGKDTQGVSTNFPARGPASRALFKVDDGKASTQGLHNLRILVTPADTDWMFDAKNLMSNDLVGATVIDDEKRAFYDVGVRLKSSERGRPEVARVGFALRFSPDDRFRGMYRDFMVDRSEGVGYGQRELLFNQAMNHAGAVTSHYDDLVHVLTPRPEHVGPAHLQMARFGDLLLDFQFDKGGDGMLFEYELIYHPLTTDNGTPEGYKLPQPDSVVGIPIHDLGDDKEAYRFPFIIKNNRWRDDYRAFIQYAKTFGLSGPQFDQTIDGVIDVDQWLRAFAFTTLCGAVDNYGGDGAQHNADFFVRPSDDRVLYFPHDLDFYGGWPQSPVVGNGDLAKIIARPDRARIFYGHLYDIISTSYNGTYMAYWANHLGQLLPAQDFAGHLQFIADRSSWVLSSAPNSVMNAIPKVAFAITTNGGAPLSVTTPTVTLDGIGWIDVAEVWRKQPQALVGLTWSGKTAWQATVSLSCGLNALELDAFDRHGKAVGSDTLSVTRTGGGCP